MTPESLGKLADACIHCGLCLEACPTYAELGTETDSPRGRIYFMRGMIEGWLAPTPDVTKHLDTCLGCRACETACPSGVQYGHLLEEVRAHITEPARPIGLRGTFWRWVVRHVLPYEDRFRLATAPLRLLARSDREWMPTFLRRQVDLMPSASPRQDLPAFTPAIGARRGQVGFLAGCAMPVLYPGVNVASVRLLAEVGFDVVVPPQAGCCGALQSHDGDAGSAARNGARVRDAFRDCELIVTNSAGCGAAMKAYPPEFASKVRDLSEALLGADWRPKAPAHRGVAVYHDPCHLSHGQQVRSAPRELLKRAGYGLVDVAEAEYCCGGAGTYALLQPALSDSLMARKVTNLMVRSPDLIVSANPSCLMQIARGLKGKAVPVLHLAEALLEPPFVVGQAKFPN